MAKKLLDANEFDLLLETLRKRSLVYLEMVESGRSLAGLPVPDLRRIQKIVSEEMIETGLTEDGMELNERGVRLDDLIGAFQTLLNEKDRVAHRDC